MGSSQQQQQSNPVAPQKIDEPKKGMSKRKKNKMPHNYSKINRSIRKTMGY